MPKLNRVIAHTAPYGLMGFMWHTNTVFDEINQEIQRLAVTTYSKLFTLKDCMKKVQDWCTHCEQELKDMEEALVYAKEARSFGQIDVVEMREVCQYLRNTFQLLAETNERVYIQGEAFKKDISYTKKWFKHNYTMYRMKYWGLGSCVGAILTLSATDNILLATLGGLLGTGMTHLGMYCTSYTKSHNKIILRRVLFDTNRINDTANGSIITMRNIVNHLQGQFELACKNDRTKIETGIRVKKQVDMMITDINVLRYDLNNMKFKSQVNERDIEDIMKFENVVDLLKL